MKQPYQEFAEQVIKKILKENLLGQGYDDPKSETITLTYFALTHIISNSIKEYLLSLTIWKLLKSFIQLGIKLK